jgi:hypothetical protein
MAVSFTTKDTKGGPFNLGGDIGTADYADFTEAAGFTPSF